MNGITNNTGTTALTYDILYGDGVVISSARNGEQTSYTYGLERISAQTGKTRAEYVYDGRGSVAAEVSYNNAWYTFGGGLSKKQITSKSYTPFGEQIGEATSGFGYNGEYYNAASGMIYLRARFYAPEMNRFSQKDILRGSILQPGSLNRYLYVQNDPVNFVDPSGMRQVAGMYGDGTGRTSTTRSSSRTSYTPPSYPAPSGPARSTASTVNPYNTVRATSQAISDARRAADIANSRAPGSPAAYRATQAYYETQRLAAQAVASHNTQAGIKAVQTSQASVNYVNNVVTGRAPNTYSPYDAHGNVYSYYNSSYDTGKIPSPDALTIEEVDADSVYYCEGGKESSSVQVIVYDKIHKDDGYQGFRIQAENSPYFKASNQNVNMVYVETAEDFINAWNSIGKSENLYIYVHAGQGTRAGRGALIFENQAIAFGNEVLPPENEPITSETFIKYSYDRLSKIDVGHIYLFACDGANYDVGSNIAVELASKSGAEVTANTGGVSFASVFGSYVPHSSPQHFGVWEQISINEDGIPEWQLQWPLGFIGGEVK